VTTNTSANPLRRSWVWPWCVIALLAANVGVVAATVIFALRDPQPIDPSYDSALRAHPQTDNAPGTMLSP
jgi:hypothetical protein